MIAQSPTMPATYEEIALNYNLTNQFCSQFNLPKMEEKDWFTHIMSKDLRPIVKHLTSSARTSLI